MPEAVTVTVSPAITPFSVGVPRSLAVTNASYSLLNKTKFETDRGFAVIEALVTLVEAGGE